MMMKRFLPGFFLLILIVMIGVDDSAYREIVESAEITASANDIRNALQLVDTVTLAGHPYRLDIRCTGFGCSRSHELVYYNDNNDSLHFVDVNGLHETREPIWVSSHNPFDHYFAIDKMTQAIYSLRTVVECNTGGLNERDCWEQLWVGVIDGHEVLDWFTINDHLDNNPPLEDEIYPYDPQGFVIKDYMSEGQAYTRLFIQDSFKRNIDVVDVLPGEEGLEQMSRHSYAPELPCEPNFCSNRVVEHDVITVETTHDSDSELMLADDVYVYYGPVVRIGHDHTNLSDDTVDYFDEWPYPNGIRQVKNGAEDRLYVLPNAADFDSGYLGVVDTTTNEFQYNIELQYFQQKSFEVDWHDGNRAFVLTNDFFGNSQLDQLLLHMIYDGQLVDTIPLANNWDGGFDLDLVFDPYSRKLFITDDETLYVVQVNIGAGAPPSPQAVASKALTPGNFAEMSVPDGSAKVVFYGNFAQQPMTFTYRDLGKSAGRDLVAGRVFELSAETNTGTAITDFGGFNAEITLNYSDAEINPLQESEIGIYRLVDGTWQPSGAAIDTTANTITFLFRYAGTYAIMGEAQQVFLPGVQR